MSPETPNRSAALSEQDAECFGEAKACFARGEHERAAHLLEALLRSNSAFARGWFLLGYTEGLRGRFEAAIEPFQRAVALAPEDAEFRFFLAKAFGSAGRPGEAVQAYRDTLALAPEHAAAHAELGRHLHALGELEGAIRHLEQATRLASQDASAFAALGSALRAARRLEEAEAALREACRLDAGNARVLRELGLVLKSRGRWEGAIDALERSLERAPKDAKSLVALGVILARAERGPQAIDVLRRALAADPENTTALGWLIREQEQECEWDGLAERTQKARELLHASGETIHPFAWLSRSASGAEQRLAADRWAGRILAQLPRHEGVTPALAGSGRIRLGYVSADFHDHATAYLLADVIELHDRRAFEVIGYSIGRTRAGAMRERLIGAFDRFVDLADESDAQAAAHIRNDGIELLIDLKGYTQHARPELIARRPAPVIVNYLGYPGTLGRGIADYLVGDAVVSPLEHAAWFAEKIVLLPDSYQPNDRRRRVGENRRRAAYGLPPRGLVLCSFNQTYKISPEIFGLWGELLSAVPGAVLWLLEYRSGAIARLRRELAARGIAPERLIAAPRIALTEHLGRLQCADLALDTFPYTSHTTASDALWAGVPLVALAGETFASRVSASLLHAVGLPELATWSFEQHRALLLELVSNPSRLAAIRARLAQARLQAPLFDSARYTRHLEQAFSVMSQRARAGQPPEHITVR